jgi:hypothetical protein
LFIRERPSIPSRFACWYSCSFVWAPLLDDELPREELERELEVDLPREEPFVSPFCARCLLTVRAAISFARFVERPCFFSLSLTCSYWRSRFPLQAFGISNPFRLEKQRSVVPGCAGFTRQGSSGGF